MYNKLQILGFLKCYLIVPWIDPTNRVTTPPVSLEHLTTVSMKNGEIKYMVTLPNKPQ